MKNRIIILNEIFENFQQITQWLPNHIDYACKYMYKAESLIELLEVEDCGSVGGYDENSPTKKESGFLLFDRYLTLVRKYNNENDIEPVCNFTIKSLTNYFIKLSKLRKESYD